MPLRSPSSGTSAPPPGARLPRGDRRSRRPDAGTHAARRKPKMLSKNLRCSSEREALVYHRVCHGISSFQKAISNPRDTPQTHPQSYFPKCNSNKT